MTTLLTDRQRAEGRVIVIAGTKYPVWTPQETDAIARRYRANHPLADISRDTGRSPAAIVARMNKLGVFRKTRERRKPQHMPAIARQIIAEVAAEYGVEPEDILGRDTTRPASVARQAAYLALRNRVRIAGRPAPYEYIGRWVGRHHVTVIYGVEAAASREATL